MWADVALLPLGKVVRALFAVPGLGPWLSRHRSVTRVAWQVNRLDPHHVLDPIRDRVGDVVIWRNPRRAAPIWGAAGAELRYFESINPAHWWLVAHPPLEPAIREPERADIRTLRSPCAE